MDRADPLRRALDGRALARALRDRPFYADVETTAATGSTNADVAALARSGAPEGVVRATDHQLAGRGRLARSWTSPPGAGIAVSVLLRPTQVPRDRWTWLPLLAGVVVARAVALAGVEAELKWPNDVLVDDRKIAGILVEVVVSGAPDAVVVGIGLNVTNRIDELPPGGTSLALAGAAALDRLALLTRLLGDLALTYEQWREHAGEPGPVRAAYLGRCATIGQVVRVELPGGAVVHGTAMTVDVDGRLVISTGDGSVALGAGDVVHVRSNAEPRSLG